MARALAHHHDGGVQADVREEPGALQGNVRRADDQRLSGRLLQLENIVTRDVQGRVHTQDGAGAAAAGHDKAAGSVLLGAALLVRALNLVRIEEGGVLVLVGDALVTELDLVAPVEAADVVLDGFDHLAPAGRKNSQADQPKAEGGGGGWRR